VELRGWVLSRRLLSGEISISNTAGLLHTMKAAMNATKYEPMKGLSNGTRLETFALVTTEPNELVSQIHERLALIPDER
jgi:putative SOS response-associated peptidase YedK